MPGLDGGRQMMLLCLAGTIRVVFAGNAYNIPVAIWVPLLYPAQPPFVHVMPTPTMLIKPSKHVDVNGKVYHPFLAFWHTRPDSTLSNFVRIMQDIFSAEPPVYARPAGAPAPPPSQQPQQSPPPQQQQQQSTGFAGGARPNLTQPGIVIPAALPSPSGSRISYLPVSKPPPPPPPQGGGSSLGSNGFTLPISISPSPGLPSLSTPRIPTGRISPQPGGGSSGASSGVNGAGGGLAHQGIAHNPVWNAAGSSVGPATSGTVTPPPLMPKRPAALNHGPQQPGSPHQQTHPASFPRPTSTQTTHSGTSGASASELDLPVMPKFAGTVSSVTPPPRPPHVPAMPQQDEATVRRNAVRNRLNQRLRQVSDAVARDMDRLAQINKTLKERERHIAGMHAFLLDAEKRLQAEVEELEARCNEVRESIAKIKEEPDVDVETFIVAATPRDNQLLELVAEDHAIDDTIYQLNKGLGSSHLQHNVTSFLKNVRALAREQFMKRALIKTIRETARQEGQ
ncbi:Suppressor protein stp22 of temperature-sensitive alpha-factor receptor and arginine permease [Polyrhizophydium stewartii]|uniref:Suppressor protein stp22 of temperature-sensitive alpha-factor receptor and arginine permease n=1 Tax=Polyrhizophydium stewartii TaxID=2732419 RepID=A0ABR4NIS5_9FUNG